MLRGLTTSPKLFLKKILIEDGSPTGFTQNGYIDLYTDAFKNEDSKQNSVSKKIRFTLEFDMKLKYPPHVQNEIEQKSINYINFQKSVKAMLNGKIVKGYVYNSRSEYKAFLTLDGEKQEDIASSILGNKLALQGRTPFSSPIDNIDDLSVYTYYDEGVPYISIPLQLSFIYEKAKDEENPSFMAPVYCLYREEENSGVISPDTLASEIIFDDGEISTQTGLFVISDTYSYKGQEESLFETVIFTDVEDKDPITGIPIGATKPTDLVEQVNKEYGAPGDIWVGPIHWHQYIKEDDPNSGAYRPMAGALHSPNNPHPYLEYVLKPNNKIVDFRSVGAIEKLFVYNSNIYEQLLASSANVTYTGNKKKNTLDEMVRKQAIVSEANYSIRPITRTNQDNFTTTKNNIHFLFAIDKMKLLKETTKLPGLLDKLIFINSGFMASIIQQIDIFHFEIIRINKTTNESMSLITGDNDTEFDDYNAKNYLGKDISKGFKLRNKTALIQAENNSTVSFYEFTDGEMDANGYDDDKYTYKISLKFRDPLITYLSDRLQQVRAIIKDLDELLYKSELKIKDNILKKFINVYDTYKDEFNAQFVEESLNPPPKPQLPLEFTFSENEIPNSIETAFDDSLSSLTWFLISLNPDEQLEPYKNFDAAGQAGAWVKIVNTKNYIKNSLRLSSTSPTLIQKVRSLMVLMEDRFTKSLLLYTTENVTKKEVGFTTDDYIKSTNVKNAGNFTIEFDYTFAEHIDLFEARNRMDWLALTPQGVANGLKVISVAAYKQLVTINKEHLLTDVGKQKVADENIFSYGFIPYSNCLVKLFNRRSQITSPNTYQYQAIRKKILDRITGKGNSVLIPELLSYFGIKFSFFNETAASMIQDTSEDEQKSMNFNFVDNFGEGFDPSEPVESLNPLIPLDVSPAFGSVEDPKYNWQGMSYDDYPIIFAESILNILTSDNQTKKKDIQFFRNEFLKMGEPAGFVPNKSFPYEINLFASKNVAESNQSEVPFEESYVKSSILNALFDQDGDLNYDSYPLFIFFLGLFGRVHYFTGFKQGFVSDNLTPSSYKDRNLIRSMTWAPLTKSVIDNLPLGKQLYCKVELFEGDEASQMMLDQKIIDLFKNFYTYNKYFFITASGAAIGPVILNAVAGTPAEGVRVLIAEEEGSENLPAHETVEVLRNLDFTEERMKSLSARTSPSEVVRVIESVEKNIRPGEVQNGEQAEVRVNVENAAVDSATVKRTQTAANKIIRKSAVKQIRKESVIDRTGGNR